jgi:hypothetical protein
MRAKIPQQPYLAFLVLRSGHQYSVSLVDPNGPKVITPLKLFMVKPGEAGIEFKLKDCFEYLLSFLAVQLSKSSQKIRLRFNSGHLSG